MGGGGEGSKLQIFTLAHTDPALLFCHKSLRCATNNSTKNLGCASAILSILGILGWFVAKLCSWVASGGYNLVLGCFGWFWVVVACFGWFLILASMKCYLLFQDLSKKYMRWGLSTRLNEF